MGGFEIFIDDIDRLDELASYVFDNISQTLFAQSLRDINPNIFDWIEMQSLNKYIILGLMVLVAGINMVTLLLVLILERTNMVGVLKALGNTNWSTQKIFLYNAVYITGLGMLLGNIIGIGLCLAQQHFEIITLDEVSYYVSTVPIELNPLSIIIMNASTIVVCTLMLIIPSHLVTRITPVKAIRFS